MVPYEFLRIFCATAPEQEPEREAFHRVLTELNESYAMDANILLVPLSLAPHMTDKRPFQSAVAWNIRQCSVYVQVFDGDWGPPERNFEADYALALQCAANPACPMQHVALIPSAPIEEFKRSLRTILENWVATAISARQEEVVSR